MHKVYVRRPEVCIAYVSGYGIAGVRLDAFRPGTHEPLEGDGREFPDADAARAFAIARGYVVPYEGRTR